MQLYSFTEVPTAKIMTMHILSINQLNLMVTYLLFHQFDQALAKMLPKRCFKSPSVQIHKAYLATQFINFFSLENWGGGNKNRFRYKEEEQNKYVKTCSPEGAATPKHGMLTCANRHPPACASSWAHLFSQFLWPCLLVWADMSSSTKSWVSWCKHSATPF